MAIFRLRKYLVENKVDVLHAHSTSFFISALTKLTLPRIKIIWHDHYGISQDLNLRKNLSLKCGSVLFSGIISVNTALKKWAESYLLCSNIKYIPNFTVDFQNSDQKFILKGQEGKRIVCVANLRPQKNHEMLLKVAVLIKKSFPEWSFHLLGQDFTDDYSNQLLGKIIDLNLQETVYFYGSVTNVNSVLKQCDIGVLPSFSEGLPLAILEYGLCKLAVIATNVGEISKIITSENDGIITESNNLYQFYEALEKLIIYRNKRIELGENLYRFVQLNYSKESIIQEYLDMIKIFFSSKNNINAE